MLPYSLVQHTCVHPAFGGQLQTVANDPWSLSKALGWRYDGSILLWDQSEQRYSVLVGLIAAGSVSRHLPSLHVDPGICRLVRWLSHVWPSSPIPNWRPPGGASEGTSPHRADGVSEDIWYYWWLISWLVYPWRCVKTDVDQSADRFQLLRSFQDLCLVFLSLCGWNTSPVKASESMRVQSESFS